MLLAVVHVGVAMSPGTLIDKGLCVTSARDGEPVLQSPGCDAGCATTGQCGECRCQSCSMCACGQVDPETGTKLSEMVCGHVDAMRQQFYLGPAATPAECAGLCDHYYRPDQGHRECTMWQLVDGACLGSFMASLVKPSDARNPQVGFATCAPEGAVQAAKAARQPPPVFALVQTIGSMAVTPSMAARMARARAQFAGTPHFYRVALVSRNCISATRLTGRCKWHPGLDAAEDTRAYTMLARAVGNNSVALISERTVEREFPGLLPKAHEIRWSDTRQPVWLANLCDLPGITWYVTHARKLKDRGVKQVWVVQHDIGWTGQLPATLALFGNEHDLLCEGLGPVSQNWVHAQETNHPIPAGAGMACLLPATRYSVRLLDDQVAALRQGNVSYCEMRAATLCNMAGWGCRSSDLRGQGMLGPFSFHTAIPEERLMALTGRQPWPGPAAAKPGRSMLEALAEFHPHGRAQALAPPLESGPTADGMAAGAGRGRGGRVLSSVHEHSWSSKKKKPPAEEMDEATRALWAKVAPFTPAELHTAQAGFAHVSHGALAEVCRAGGSGGQHGRLYHRVFEPGAARDKYADCPMICAPDWRGFLEIEVARRTGCVFNCLANPVNFSDPHGNDGGGVKSEAHTKHHRKKG